MARRFSSSAARSPPQPILLLFVFLLGFLPTWLILRARIWGHRRRIEAMERNRLAALPSEAPAAGETESVA
jgi:hypothetical protein